MGTDSSPPRSSATVRRRRFRRDPDLVAVIARRLRVSPEEIVSASLIKRSVDCRQRKPRVIATLEAVVLDREQVLTRFKQSVGRYVV